MCMLCDIWLWTFFTMICIGETLRFVSFFFFTISLSSILPSLPFLSPLLLPFFLISHIISFTSFFFLLSLLSVWSNFLSDFLNIYFLHSIGVLLSNTRKVYHHFDATFKSFSTFFASMLLQFSASLEVSSDVDFMRQKDIFSFTGNTEPGIPFDGLDINSPSYHKVY